MGLLHNTMKFMKNNLHNKFEFYWSRSKNYNISIFNDQNISNLLTAMTKNLHFIFRISYLTLGS